MFEKIKEIFVNLQKHWKRVPLRWKGRISIILPVTAVIISSIFAFMGNNRRAEIQSDIERKFSIVSDFDDVLTLMVNAETGIRGFQLTKKDEFLQPYQLAQTSLPEKLNNLQNLIDAEPGEKPRLEKQAIFSQIKDLISKQLVDLEWQKNYVVQNSGFDEELYQHIQLGKKYMDEIRSKLGDFQAQEQNLLTERIEEINSVRQRDYIALFITLFIALITRSLAWYLFNIGSHQRVGRMIKNLKELRKDDGYEIKNIGEMEVLEEEVEYFVEKYKEKIV